MNSETTDTSQIVEQSSTNQTDKEKLDQDTATSLSQVPQCQASEAAPVMDSQAGVANQLTKEAVPVPVTEPISENLETCNADNARPPNTLDLNSDQDTTQAHMDNRATSDKSPGEIEINFVSGESGVSDEEEGQVEYTMDDILDNISEDEAVAAKTEESEAPENTEKTEDVLISNKGKTGEMGTGDVEKPEEVGTGDVGKTEKVRTGDVGKSGEVGTGGTNKTEDMGTGDTDKTEEMGTGDVDKTQKVGTGDTNKTEKVGTGDTDKTENVGTGDTNKTEEVGTVDTDKTEEAGTGDTDQTEQVGICDTDKTEEMRTGDTNKHNEVGTGDTYKTEEVGTGDTYKTEEVGIGNIKKAEEVGTGDTDKTEELGTDSTEKIEEVGIDDTEKTEEVESLSNSATQQTEPTDSHSTNQNSVTVDKETIKPDSPGRQPDASTASVDTKLGVQTNSDKLDKAKQDSNGPESSATDGTCEVNKDKQSCAEGLSDCNNSVVNISENTCDKDTIKVPVNELNSGQIVDQNDDKMGEIRCDKTVNNSVNENKVLEDSDEADINLSDCCSKDISGIGGPSGQNTPEDIAGAKGLEESSGPTPGGDMLSETPDTQDKVPEPVDHVASIVQCSDTNNGQTAGKATDSSENASTVPTESCLYDDQIGKPSSMPQAEVVHNVECSVMKETSPESQGDVPSEASKAERPLLERQNSALNRLDRVLAEVDMGSFDDIDEDELQCSNVIDFPRNIEETEKGVEEVCEEKVDEPISSDENEAENTHGGAVSEHKQNIVDTNSPTSCESKDTAIQWDRSIDQKHNSESDHILTFTPEKKQNNDSLPEIVDSSPLKGLSEDTCGHVNELEASIDDVYAMEVDTMLEVPSMNGNATFTRKSKRSKAEGANTSTPVDYSSIEVFSNSAPDAENDPLAPVCEAETPPVTGDNRSDAILVALSGAKNVEDSDIKLPSSFIAKQTPDVLNNNKKSDTTAASVNVNTTEKRTEKCPEIVVESGDDENRNVQSALKEDSLNEAVNNAPVHASTNAVLSSISEDGGSSAGTSEKTNIGVLMRKKGAARHTPASTASVMNACGVSEAGLTKDEVLQQKMEFEIKMRDGTAKLLAASKTPTQRLEAAKSLLTCNARMMAYMSELQRRNTKHAMQGAKSKEEGAESTTCSAKLGVSGLRIPLMWRETDYFKNKGGRGSHKDHHRRYTVFCLVVCGTDIHDTTLVSEVDSSQTDIVFDDVITFPEVQPDFEVTVEVYSHRMTSEDQAVSSTPRKIKKHINKLSTSVGRRLSGMKEDHDSMSHMIVGPKFEKIAEAKLKLADVSDNVCTYSLTSSPSEAQTDGAQELPLFGNVCCRLAAQPRCMGVEILAAPLHVRKSKQSESAEHWAVLKDQLIFLYHSAAQHHAHRQPSATIPVIKSTQLKEVSRKGEAVLELSNQSARVRTTYILQGADSSAVSRWNDALRLHINNQVAWLHACNLSVDLSAPAPPRASSYIQPASKSLYDALEVDSPMTRILNRLNIESDEEEN